MKDKKTVTIRIDHAYLEAIEIEPNDIIIDEVKEGLLARGDIELTVADYNAIEHMHYHYILQLRILFLVILELQLLLLFP